MYSRVTVIGDGAMGTLCALILAGNDVQVRVWGRNPKHTSEIESTRENNRYLPGHKLPSEIAVGSDVAWALDDCELVVCAVPCQFIRSVWRELPSRPTVGRVLSITKGIESKTLLRPTQIINEFWPHTSMAMLTGPCIAAEAAAGLPTSVVIAAQVDDLASHAQASFNTESFRVYTNRDLVGVEMAGAHKNVIAIAAGIVDGLGLGDNAKAAMITRGVAEISRLGVALGAIPETFAGLAGMGDLVTTCISPHGRNRTAGQQIGQGQSVEDVVASTQSVIEGIPTSASILQIAEQNNVEIPITRAVGDVLFDGISPAAAVRALMTRELKQE